MRLIWRPAALHDLGRLADFISELHPSRSAVLADLLVTEISPLQQMPRMGRPHASRPGVRELILQIGGGRYVVQYLVDETRDDVVILRIFHSREARP